MWHGGVFMAASNALAVEQSAEGDVGGVTGPCASFLVAAILLGEDHVH
jgi:hypothetical protein